MNWSNGQLARHSRKSYNSDATRQRQYFAQSKKRKVTGSFREKYDAASFVPSYLQDQTNSEKLSRETVGPKEAKRRLLTLNEESATLGTASRAKKDENAIDGAKKLQHQDIKIPESDDSIETKRRMLLQQRDWSGMELQRPVIIKYPERSKSFAKTKHRRIQSSELNKSEIIANTLQPQLQRDTIIQIANQEYRWSPGKNSVRTRYSDQKQALPATPVYPHNQSQFNSSSAPQSLSSLVYESPCAGRSLQVRAGNENHDLQLHSTSDTSPSVLEEPLPKAVPQTLQFYHPQPIRKMPLGIYTQLSELVEDRFSVLPSDTEQRKSAVSHDYDDRESLICQNDKADATAKTYIGESSNVAGLSSEEAMRNRQSLFGLIRQPLAPATNQYEATALTGESRDRLSSIACSITTPAAPSQSWMPAASSEVGGENEMRWKKFVLGPTSFGLGLGLAEYSDASFAKGRADGGDIATGDATKTPELLVTMASTAKTSPKHFLRCSTLPEWPAKNIQTISVKGPVDGVNASNHDGTDKNRDSGPVHSGEEHDQKKPTAERAEEKKAGEEQIASLKTRPTTSKVESVFHAPSLFVGRLVGSGSGSGSGNGSGMMAAESKDNGPKDVMATATGAQDTTPAVKKKRRSRRAAGRPDIRALPNIRDDPIELTP